MEPVEVTEGGGGVAPPRIATSAAPAAATECAKDDTAVRGFYEVLINKGNKEVGGREERVFLSLFHRRHQHHHHATKRRRNTALR